MRIETMLVYLHIVYIRCNIRLIQRIVVAMFISSKVLMNVTTHGPAAIIDRPRLMIWTKSSIGIQEVPKTAAHSFFHKYSEAGLHHTKIVTCPQLQTSLLCLGFNSFPLSSFIEIFDWLQSGSTVATTHISLIQNKHHDITKCHVTSQNSKCGFLSNWREPRSVKRKI